MNLFRKSQLKGRKDLQEALQPRFSFGCNFLSVADDYYKTFCKSNVQLITNPITQVTETSIVTADTEEVFDVSSSYKCCYDHDSLIQILETTCLITYIYSADHYR